MGRNLKRLTAVLVLLFLMVSCITVPVSASDQAFDMDYLQGVMKMINEMYNGEVDQQSLINGALKGMLEVVDPYTTFYNPEEFNDFMQSTEGNYSGVGITMSKEDKYVMIIKVTPSSPADKAGLVAGDKIVQVDGKDVSDMEVEEIAGFIKGEAGTKVTLGIIKKGKDTVTQIELTRELIQVNPVTYEIQNDIAHITIDSFNANTYTNLAKVLTEVDNRKISKVVLDLRNNPGGDVNECAKVAGFFVPEGLITKLDFKSDLYTDTEYLSTLKTPKYKLAVLVNENTASASEILAGAIQDTKSGVIIGTKTYGKGKVQTFIPILTPEAYKKYSAQVGKDVTNAYDLIYKYNITPLDNEIIGWSKMTTGYYYTPNGRMIDGVGLEPDIKVEDSQIINDVDIGSINGLSKTIKPTLNTEDIDVFYAEMILKASGYEVDTPDYVLDQKTFKAIAKFQQDNGLYSYGVLDFSTQQALNNTVQKLVSSSDKQYNSALEYLNK